LIDIDFAYNISGPPGTGKTYTVGKLHFPIHFVNRLLVESLFPTRPLLLPVITFLAIIFLLPVANDDSKETSTNGYLQNAWRILPDVPSFH
jgi:hypothetical protein